MGIYADRSDQIKYELTCEDCEWVAFYIRELGSTNSRASQAAITHVRETGHTVKTVCTWKHHPKAG